MALMQVASVLSNNRIMQRVSQCNKFPSEKKNNFIWMRHDDEAHHAARSVFVSDHSKHEWLHVKKWEIMLLMQGLDTEEIFNGFMNFKKYFLNFIFIS